MPQTETLQDVIDDFVRRVRALTRQEMLAAFSASLGEAAGAPRSGPGRRTKARGARSKKGAKRDPKALAALVQQLAQAIKAKPGSRIEEIGKAMRVPTKDLALPIRKLLAGKAIKKTGTRRATRYSPK